MSTSAKSFFGNPSHLSSLRTTLRLACVFAAVKLATHIFANWLAPYVGYGMFRDELYFIDCGRRLAWGYVDQAPMVALQARVAELLFGHSLVGLRLFSALAGSVTVFLTGVLVWALEGPLLAQAIAMTAVLLTPFYLGIDNYLSMNSFEPVFWMAILLLTIMLARGVNPRWWLLIGVVCGLGIENKQDIVFFVVALIAGLLISPQRAILFNRWVFGAAVIAAMFAMPNLIWQIRNSWPTWQFLHNPTRPNDHRSFLGFVRQQVLLFNITMLLWVAGLFWLQLSRRASRFRFLSIAYCVFFLLMFGLKAKGYYLASYYPVLIAAGAIFWESSTRHRRWVFATVAFCIITYDAVFMATVIPMQKPADYLKYRDAVTDRILTIVTGPRDRSIGQWYADRIGWPEMVRSVADVYDALPPDERSRTAILSQFYGDASAIDVLGAKYGLPNAISGNQNFWLWGPRGYDGEYVIAVGFSRDEIPPVFGSVTKVGEVYSPYSMEYEHRPIFLCKDMHPSLSQYWPHLKHWR